MDYSKLIHHSNNLLAHFTSDRNDLLVDHLNQSKMVFNKLDEMYQIIDKFKNTFKELTFKTKKETFSLSNESLLMLERMFVEAIPLHDIGKINPKFQLDKMNIDVFEFMDVKSAEKLKKKIKIMNSNHSLLSSLIYIDIFYSKISEEIPKKERLILTYLLLNFAYIISRHHSQLNSANESFNENKLKEFLSELMVADYQYLSFYKLDFKLDAKIGKALTAIKAVDFDTANVYIWNKLLYSIMTASDFIATDSFYKNLDCTFFDFNSIQNPERLKETFFNTPIYQGILSYKKDKSYFKTNKLPVINELRSDILLECKENISNAKDNLIFNIESPTGSGKTLNSLSCALELLQEGSKLFYVFPVNTISTQTHKVLSGIFKDTISFQEVNSITPLPLIKNDDNKIDYNKILLDKHLLNYPGILTSNVRLFNLLFGCNRESTMGLFSLFNSVVILDEIQNYKNSIWKEIIEFLVRYSKIMNIKIIIMSATLPNLEELVNNKSNHFINLLPNSNVYYQNSLFKDRVKIDDSLLGDTVDFEKLLDLILKEVKNRNRLMNCHSKFIIEFIKKKTAQEFYEFVIAKSLSDYDVYELDGDDNTLRKKEIIDECQKPATKNILLITTQVIEAGVDIDFDLGAKDATFPDVDEQFLGRINRSCNKTNCKAFFFNLDKEETIYRGDYRIGSNIKHKDNFDNLVNKDFNALYQKVFQKLKRDKEKLLVSEVDNLFKVELKELQYAKIYKKMKLIESETFEIFIPYVLGDLDGYKIWEEYITMLEDKTITYAKKQVLLINMREKMSYFTYSLFGNGLLYEDNQYGCYYLKDGEKYLEHGKLKLEKLKDKYLIFE